jgi:DnaJ family protein A protein 2
MNAEDLFSAFFGGGRRQRSGPRKGEDVVHQINVSLEVWWLPERRAVWRNRLVFTPCESQDLYNGRTRKLAINRKVPADPDADPGVCSSCDGHGAKMVTRQVRLRRIHVYAAPSSVC